MVSLGIVHYGNNYPPLLQRLDYKIAALLIAVALIYQLLPLPTIANYTAQTLQLNRIVGYYPFFVLGILLRRDMVKIETKVSRKACILTLLSIICLYVIACWSIHSFAYKSGFYLAFAGGIKSSVLTAGSYFTIILICILLLMIVTGKKKWYSKYGARTMNVYVLHMMVVFPLCYGVFAHLPQSTPFKLFNSLIAVGICLFFFSDYVNKLIQSVLSKPRWGWTLIVYLISICLVNWQVISHFTRMFFLI